MDLSAFDNLADDARVWVYGFVRPFSDDDQRIINERLAAFIDDWNSHKVDVKGAYTIVHDRFVILAGISDTGISGCSIDSSVENFKRFRDAHGLDGLDRDLVFYRDRDGAVQALPRKDFRVEVEARRLGPDTVVFDTTIQTLGDLRAGRFELPFKESWHARLFKTSQVG